MKNNETDAILSVVLECDAAILATCDVKFPDVRHVSNIMNKKTKSLDLFFMTSSDSPKYEQLRHNSACALYYFDEKSRHAVRLYGNMEFVNDTALRKEHWRPEFSKFGYGGPENPDFILMRFVPHSYKYYIGLDMKTGTL